MQLSPLDLLDEARRWSGEADRLRQVPHEVAGQETSAFGPALREDALACAAAWGDATGQLAARVEGCADGLRHTAELVATIDAEVAASFHRLAGGRGG